MLSAVEEDLNDSEIVDPTDEVSSDTPEGEPDEGKSEELAEAGEGDEQEVELYEVTVNGETLEVSYDELLSGYQKNADYTQGKQEQALDRKASTEARETYEGLSGSLQTQIESLEAQVKLSEGSVDWDVDEDGLPVDDYDMPKHQRHQAKLGKVKKQVEKAKSEKDKADQDAFQARAQIEQVELLKVVPEWKDSKAMKAGLSEISDYAKSIGFTSELNNMIDHRFYRAFKDAAAFANGKTEAKKDKEDVAKKRNRKPPSSSKPKKGVKTETKSMSELFYGSK